MAHIAPDDKAKARVLRPVLPSTEISTFAPCFSRLLGSRVTRSEVLLRDCWTIGNFQRKYITRDGYRNSVHEDGRRIKYLRTFVPCHMFNTEICDSWKARKDVLHCFALLCFASSKHYFEKRKRKRSRMGRKKQRRRLSFPMFSNPHTASSTRVLACRFLPRCHQPLGERNR